MSGLCRQFYISNDGKEHTKYFQPPGLVAIPFAEMLSKKPSRCFIQAVVDTNLVVMSHHDFQTLFDVDYDTQKLARRIAENYFIEKDQREYEFLNYDAEQRYDAFCEKYGELVEFIPQYQIASYIRVTPVTLSRILTNRKVLKASPDC
jgi:CRP-like cAMP-binding protein